MIRNLIVAVATVVVVGVGVTFQALWATSHEDKNQGPASSSEPTGDHTGKPGETK